LVGCLLGACRTVVRCRWRRGRFPQLRGHSNADICRTDRFSFERRPLRSCPNENAVTPETEAICPSTHHTVNVPRSKSGSIAQVEPVVAGPHRSVMETRKGGVGRMHSGRAFAILLTSMSIAGCGSSVHSGLASDVTRHSSSPGSSSAAPTSAIEVCRSALASHTVISGTWSTVGGVRSWIRGGVQDQKNRYPLADAFPGAAAKESAAWCWTRDQPQTDAAWAVRSDAPPVHAITLTCQGCQGGRPIPSGAPLPVP
jgi:hypothetical protein